MLYCSTVRGLKYLLTTLTRVRLLQSIVKQMMNCFRFKLLFEVIFPCMESELRNGFDQWPVELQLQLFCNNFTEALILIKKLFMDAFIKILWKFKLHNYLQGDMFLCMNWACRKRQNWRFIKLMRYPKINFKIGLTLPNVLSLNNLLQAPLELGESKKLLDSLSTKKILNTSRSPADKISIFVKKSKNQLLQNRRFSW